MGIDYRHELNDKQFEAATSIDGPLLIIAGAGSGKTRVITFRMAYMLDMGIPQASILALTFTNKAAREMSERVKHLTGRKLSNLTVSTFHAFGVKVLRSDIGHLGYRENFSIHDSGGQDLPDQGDGAGARPSPGEPRPVRPLDALLRNQDGHEGLERNHRDVRTALPGISRPPESLQRRRFRRPDLASHHHPGITPGGAGRLPAALPLHHGGRVPGHVAPAVPVHEAPRRRLAERLRGGRRRPVHLFLAGSELREHPEVRAGLSGTEGDQARAELPLHGHDPFGGEPADPE